MNTQANEKHLKDANADPVTGEPGAHPVAAGIGAAAIGAAGLAAAVAVAGPIGVVVAAAGGALIGGYAGKAAGELIDPTSEEAFWREEHPNQPYAEPGTTFEDFAPAYRIGYEGCMRSRNRTFDAAEADLHAHYKLSAARLPWAKARLASRAAWERAIHGKPDTTVHTGVGEAAMSDTSKDGSLGSAQMPH